MNHTYLWHPHNWLHRHKLKQARAVWWSFDHWKYIWTFYSNKFPMKCFSSQQDKKKKQQQKRCWKSLCKWLWKIIMHDQKWSSQFFACIKSDLHQPFLFTLIRWKKVFNYYTFAQNCGFFLHRFHWTIYTKFHSKLFTHKLFDRHRCAWAPILH